MSFVLAVWDAARPPRLADAAARCEQLVAAEDPPAMPSPRVDGFVEECEARWPDHGEVPFASRRSPTALLLQIRAEVAAELFGELADMAERHGLVLFDPQSGVVRIPSRLSFDAQPPTGERGWFGRRRQPAPPSGSERFSGRRRGR